MKPTKLILTILILLFIQTTHAQKWVNVSPFEGLNGIKGCFISENEGWVYQWNRDYKRELYHTIDGAKTFNKIFEASDTLINFLRMFDSEIGIIFFEEANEKRTLNKTNDGGKTWSKIMTLNDTTGMFCHFFDTNIFIASTIDYDNIETRIKKTIDSGKTWYYVDYPKYEMDGETKLYYGIGDVFFLDDKTGWIAGGRMDGYGCILQTLDGGESWELIYERGMEINYIHFFDVNRGICSGRGDYSSYVDISNNNFSTLTYKYYWNGETNNYSNDVFYQNDSTIWVTGGGSIYISTDAGKNFDTHPYIDTTCKTQLRDIYLFDKGGYVFGYYNCLLKLTDTTVNIPEIVKAELNFNIYPNPIYEHLTIENNTSHTTTCIIYNMQGQIIKQISLNGYEINNINISQLSKGIYVIANEKHYKKQLIIKK